MKAVYDPLGNLIPWRPSPQSSGPPPSSYPRSSASFGGLGSLFGNAQESSCQVDGIPTNCDLAMRLKNNGSAMQCPYNDCGPQRRDFVNADGQRFSFLTLPFMAFGDGTSGYFLGGWAELGSPQEQAQILRQAGAQNSGRMNGPTVIGNAFLPSAGNSSDPCRGRSWENMVEQFNKGLADANMNLRVDSGGHFVNPDNRSTQDILNALQEHNHWERFSTNINPLHWGGIHLEGKTERPRESNMYSNKPGYDDGYWFHMIFYPVQKTVYGPNLIPYTTDDLTKPPMGFEMHCERGHLRPSSIEHGLDYLLEIMTPKHFIL